MLRYRLWDIDLIIRRTLIYGTLTATLTLTSVILILSLQFLVHTITGQTGDQPIFLVGSTLLIAALIRPFHRGIQRLIDRRFYRRTYDAARTMEVFSATLHQEVDLNQLREQVIHIVQETMQPTHVSLWLLSSPTKPSSNDLE
jgi:hypothetical protein